MQAQLFVIGMQIAAFAGGPGGSGGSGGMFGGLLDQLREISAQAWAFGVGLILILASLAMLYRAIQATAAMSFGSGPMVAAGVMGIVGVLILVMAAFNLIPAFVDMLKGVAPAAPF